VLINKKKLFFILMKN